MGGPITQPPGDGLSARLAAARRDHGGRTLALGLVVVAVVALAVVAIGLLALLTTRLRPGPDEAGATAGSAGATASRTTAPTTSPTTSAPAATTIPETSSPAGGPTAVLPLPDPGQRFTDTDSVISDVPESGDTLQDGGFFGILHDVDPVARTVAVDIAIFYGGDAAMEWLEANDPERAAEGPPENDYVIVNDVERVRVLTVAPTVRVGTWCFDTTGTMITRDRPFDEWAAAPALSGTTSCDEPGRQANDTYWVDVRGGVVAQITGQYLP